jgi:hypothetical protein
MGIKLFLFGEISRNVFGNEAVNYARIVLAGRIYESSLNREESIVNLFADEIPIAHYIELHRDVEDLLVLQHPLRVDKDISVPYQPIVLYYYALNNQIQVPPA